MRTRFSSSRAAAAFTLLEVVISITVFTFIMISILGCWKCIVSGKMIAEDAAREAQYSRIGISTVVEALTCTELSAQNFQFYGFETDTTGKFASLSLAGRMPGGFPGSGMFDDDVLRRVTFNVEKDTDGKENLMMNQTRLLDVVDEQNPGYSITLARDVNVFMLEFWSVQNGEWEVSWIPTNQLPPLVRVTLGCGHPANNPDVPFALICRTVAIPSASH